MKPKVIINGVDIYDKVDKLIKIKEWKTFRRDKLIINDITIRVNNSSNFFSVNNPVSIFHRNNWRYCPFVIYNSLDVKIWDGIVIDIARDHNTKTATIRSKDRLWQYRKRKIAYTSTDWETPADAAKNVMDAYGFTAYNRRAITSSMAWLEKKEVFIKCDIDIGSNTTFMSVLEKLAEYAVADCFTFNNEIYFKCWRPFAGGVTVNLTEKDRKREIKVYALAEKDVVNAYNISYIGGTATDSTLGEVSRNRYGVQDSNIIDGGVGTSIEIKNLTSAVYMGETLMRRTHIDIETHPRIPEAIAFTLPIRFRDLITLETYFTLTYSGEGWDKKIFEPFVIDKDENRNEMKITAYEIA